MILKAQAKAEVTLREFLRNHFAMSSRFITQLSRHKMVYVNGKYRHMSYILSPGEEVMVKLDFEGNTFKPEKRELDIVYEDEAMVIVNKDPYLTVHPTKGTPCGTLLNALAYYAKDKGEDYKIRFANRLDRDTSGLIIIAKNKYVDHRLSAQFAQRSPEKFYLALVEGKTPKSFSFQCKIGRKGDEFRRAVIEGGKDSLTYFETLATVDKISLVRCQPITGRTHQIRVHLSALSHTIIGDKLYGYKGHINRTMLHCEKMIINHPISAKSLEFTAPLKSDMKEVLEAMYE